MYPRPVSPESVRSERDEWSTVDESMRVTAEEEQSEVAYDTALVAEEYLARSEAVNLTPDQEEAVRSAVRPTMSPEEALLAVHRACIDAIGVYTDGAFTDDTAALKREEVRSAELALDAIRTAWERQGDLNSREWRRRQRSA